LLRAAVCDCFIEAGRSLGVPTDRYARETRLSLAALEDPTALVPQIPAWRFVERVTQKEGDALFGMRMSQSLAAHQIKTINPFLTDCPNLFSLLRKFCFSVRLQTNVANFTLVEAGDVVWVYTNQVEPSHGADQVELFHLSGIATVVQAALGPSWRPPMIDFQFSKPRIEITRSAALNPSQHRFARPQAGVAINRVDLSTPLQTDTYRVNSPVSTADIPGMPGNLKHQVLAAMETMLSERVPTVARIEDIANVSLRTLQRRLSLEGSGFRQLLEQARLQRAQELLTTTDLPVADIASMLGYSNPPAFSRSFRRWSAITPKTYRQLWGPRQVS
jgi:AraC-like DNA-binding protein